MRNMTDTEDVEAQLLPRSGPLLIVLSGPSGVGKDAVVARMKELKLPIHFVVTATTRPRRPGETDGEDYYFLTHERFQEMLSQDEFLEWAHVYCNFYGVPKNQVRDALGKGMDVLIKLDIQGAETIKRLQPNALFIFLAPSCMKDVEDRLKQRGTESAEEFALRLETARSEMKQLPNFDYVVINHHDGVDQAVAEIQAIITAEKRRVVPRRVEL